MHLTHLLGVKDTHQTFRERERNAEMQETIHLYVLCIYTWPKTPVPNQCCFYWMAMYSNYNM